MFLTVPVVRKASCQEDPAGFRTMRSAQFFAWSEKTLHSYLADLTAAEAVGRNLMTHKYARMENLVPKENQDPLIDGIVSIQCAWQDEVFQKYPNLMRRARSIGSSGDTAFQTSFETYLRGELETYSHDTLTSLYQDISERLKEEKNMVEEIYDHMVLGLNYQTLAEAEESAEKAAS